MNQRPAESPRDTKLETVEKNEIRNEIRQKMEIK